MAEIRTVAVQCLVNTLNTEIHIAIQNRLAQKLARIARIARYAVVFSIAYRVSRDTRKIKSSYIIYFLFLSYRAIRDTQ